MNYVPIEKYSESQTIYEYDDDGKPLVVVEENAPTYLQVNGKEIYPDGPIILNRRYALDENKLPYYPKDNLDKELYMQDQDNSRIYIVCDNSPVYALDRGTPYYASNNIGEFYALDKDRIEVYITVAGKQIYAKTTTNSQYYARKYYSIISFSEMYALDQGVPYYAKYSDEYSNDMEPFEMEFYAVNELGESTFITIDNKQIYTKLRDNFEIYPVQKNLNKVFALNTEGKPYYASDADGEQYYPRCQKGEYYMTVDNKQIYITNNYGFQEYAIQDVNGISLPIYALDEQQIPYYAKWSDDIERYAITHNNYPVYMEIDNKQIYVRDDNFNEYYATFKEVDIVALDNNVPYYATKKYEGEFYPLNTNLAYYASHDNREIYAKNEKFKEFYISLDDKEVYARNGKDETYARDSDRHQYYATDHGNPYFATLANGDPYYPQNSQGQDFYFELAHDVDGKIIRPNRPLVTFIKNPTRIVTYSDFSKNIKRTPWLLLIGAIVAILVAILVTIKTLPHVFDPRQQHVFPIASKG